MMLTDRDLAILGALTGQVRMFTLMQIALGWWSATPTGHKNAAHRLSLLVRASFVMRCEVLAHPLLHLQRPYIEWQPGDPAPQCLLISKLLQTRWCAQPRRTHVYLATPLAAARFGGIAPGQVRNSCQTTHDLHVAQIYLHYLLAQSPHLRNWMGEDRCDHTQPGQKVPDALLIAGDGGQYRAVEFGGRYSAQRLLDYHAYCEAQNLPYELW